MPQGFQIGPLTIRYYALIILAGAMLAAWIASMEAERNGKDKELIWDMLPWLLIGGILGARLWHVFTPSTSNAAMGLTTRYYMTHPLEILMIWKGGLGIPGAVVGGALALWIYAKVRKEDFLQWTDFIAPGLLVGQAIGRWGNFVNQELYGGPSDLPWAIKIEPLYRLPGFENVEKYHPLFLYEFLLNLLAAGLLLLISRRHREKLYKGDVFLLYLVFYPVIRFALEFMRLDPSSVGGFNINQSIMGVVAILAAFLLVYRHFIHPPKKVVLETEDLTAAVEELPSGEEQELIETEPEDVMQEAESTLMEASEEIDIENTDVESGLEEAEVAAEESQEIAADLIEETAEQVADAEDGLEGAIDEVEQFPPDESEEQKGSTESA